VREGACIGAATILKPWTLRLIPNAAALATASLTLLFRPYTKLCAWGEEAFYLGGLHICVCLLLQDLVQSCLLGGGGIWEDMCYDI
jgi:hypothetical protein